MYCLTLKITSNGNTQLSTHLEALTDELQEAFEDHELQTRKHVSRLEKAFQLLGEKAEAKKCDAMAGIIKEGKHIITSTPQGSMTRDAALIIAAKKV